MSNKGITVKQLSEFCNTQIKKGNGEKHILITRDDEGNGYHTLFYQFQDDIEEIKECKEAGLFHDDNDVNEIVLLG